MAQPPADPIIAEFLDDTDWSKPNKINALSVLNRWHAFCAERGTEVVDANRPDCVAYLEARRAEVAAATARVDWRMLKAFYAWAARPADEGGGQERDDDPMRRVRAPKVPTRPATKAAKADEVEAMMAAFDRSEYGRRGQAMISLMYRSGLRVGELPQLNVTDYDVIGERRAVLMITETKTGEPRLVPVHPETQRYLTRYFRKRGTAPGPLFRGDQTYTRDANGRLTTKAIQLVVTRAAKRAGVDVSPHQLRRGFTSQYLRAGGDVLSLEIIGGWADHRMPRRYLADEEAAAAVDRYFKITDDPPPTGRRRLRAVK